MAKRISVFRYSNFHQSTDSLGWICFTSSAAMIRSCSFPMSSHALPFAAKAS